MRVVIEGQDFGRYFDIYIIEEGPSGDRFFTVDSTSGDLPVWTENPLAEAMRPVKPTLTVSRTMLDALKAAFKDSKVDADEELVRRLRLEETRVDKLIDAVLAPPTHEILVDGERRQY